MPYEFNLVSKEVNQHQNYNKCKVNACMCESKQYMIMICSKQITIKGIKLELSWIAMSLTIVIRQGVKQIMSMYTTVY